MQTMSESAARAQTEKHIEEIAQAFGPDVSLFMDAGNSAPCGEDSQVDLPPQESTNLYIFTTFARAESIPPEQLDTAIPRIRAYLERSNWKITHFQEAADGQTITDLNAIHQSNDFGVSIELMHPERRIIVSVGSPCLARP